jgi:SAM-dependent methyltransferase
VNCVLCQGHSLNQWHQDKLRPYFRCEGCSLVFVPRDLLITAEEEKKRYDTHQNNEEDPRYRNYLTKIADGILPFLSPKAKGLDYGCGASTLLATIFFEAGLSMDSYDLYYHCNDDIWLERYDFIVLSEVIEHLADLDGTMEKLKLLLKPGGQLFIKTKFYPPARELFENWFYKNDPTHVQFFDPLSMAKLAALLNMKGPEDLNCTDLYRLST